MRKVSLLIAILALSICSSFANSLTIINNIPCEFSFSIRGMINPPNLDPEFQSIEIIIPPLSNTFFGSPNDLDSSFPSTGLFTHVKGFCRDVASGMNCEASVGDPMLSSLPSMLNSANAGCFPICHQGNAFTINWLTNPSGDVTIFIF